MGYSGRTKIDDSINSSEQLNTNGEFSAENTTVPFINVNGNSTLSHVIVSQNAKFNGNVKINDSHIQGTLSVNGNASLSDAIVDGEVEIRGNMIATNIQLNNPLHLIMGNITLSASTTGDIVISRVKSFWQQKPRIVLTDRTIVQGDIIFENNQKGAVVLKNSAIIKGKVSGGIIKEE